LEGSAFGSQNYLATAEASESEWDGRQHSHGGPRCRLGVHALGPGEAADGVRNVTAPTEEEKRRDASVGLLIYRHTLLLISSTSREECVASPSHCGGKATERGQHATAVPLCSVGM